MKALHSIVTALGIALTSSSVSAQISSGTTVPPQSIGARGYFALDLESMAASKSFDAVVGTTTLTGFGGGVDVLNIWRSLFARVAVSHQTKDGNRAFIFNGQPISLNIPIKVAMTPIEIGAGWRWVTRGRVRPYVGGGALAMKYSEESSFADSADDVSKTKTGYTAFGGVEIGVWKWVVVGAEGQYRGIPDALGAAPVSQDLGESNLGGFAFRVLFGISK